MCSRRGLYRYFVRFGGALEDPGAGDGAKNTSICAAIGCAVLAELLLAALFSFYVHTFARAQADAVRIVTAVCVLAALVTNARPEPPVWLVWYIVAGNAACSIAFDLVPVRFVVTASNLVLTAAWLKLRL
jgi:hypothetical protein